MAGRTQAKIQKAAYGFFRKLHSKATGSDIEERMRKHIFRNVDRVMWVFDILIIQKKLLWIFRWMLERFVKPARDILNMKPFGITIKQEIHNLQMDLIRQVLKDYKLKGRSKSTRSHISWKLCYFKVDTHILVGVKSEEDDLQLNLASKCLWFKGADFSARFYLLS